ncbi:hypothetical protein SAMN05216188_10960 [Lentzea xinjiangensis]|uniref:Uncharacterized protein n=1 Tax=Lentzea xinjiangensis TaxID=402600 RepID=A0A1H9MHK4_9PSEU|nr:hypothetical protein [Lentzea xinjiangensis]SER22999.1 hypothetical protein SAMN05216188_10960 [Lentzea xinjiangensis]
MTTTSPLVELPLLGWLVELLDRALLDAGVDAWLARTGEFLLIASLLYVATSLLVRRGFPLLQGVVRPVVDLLADFAMVLVLLPELAVTWTLTRLRLSLPSVIYLYGDAVYAANTAVKSSAAVLVQVLGWLQRKPRLFVIAVVFVLFLLWNTNTCAPGLDGCVTPVSQWTSDAGSWLDQQ